MVGNPLILREKRSTARSSTFSVDASFLLLFRPVSGRYGGRSCALRQTRASASSSLSVHGCHRLLDPPSWRARTIGDEAATRRHAWRRLMLSAEATGHSCAAA